MVPLGGPGFRDSVHSGRRPPHNDLTYFKIALCVDSTLLDK